MKSKHNKKSNVGLMFEFLSRHMVSGVMQKDNRRARQAVRILKKFYHPRSSLYEEFNLFNTLLYSQARSRDSATKLLYAVLEKARGLPYLQIGRQKYNMLCEIYKVLGGRGFFNAPVANYSVYAAIQRMLDDARGHRQIGDIADRVSCEERVLDHLCDNTEVKRIVEYKRQGLYQERFDVDNLTYKILMEKFNRKWNGRLSVAQTKVLREYILSPNSKAFNIYADKKFQEVTSYLRNYQKKAADPTITLKVEAVLKKLMEKKRDLPYLLVCVKLCEDIAEGGDIGGQSAGYGSFVNKNPQQTIQQRDQESKKREQERKRKQQERERERERMKKNDIGNKQADYGRKYQSASKGLGGSKGLRGNNG